MLLDGGPPHNPLLCKPLRIAAFVSLGEWEMPRDGLATIPQPQAPLETLLQAFYRVPELQFVRVTL